MPGTPSGTGPTRNTESGKGLSANASASRLRDSTVFRIATIAASPACTTARPNSESALKLWPRKRAMLSLLFLMISSDRPSSSAIA